MFLLAMNLHMSLKVVTHERANMGMVRGHSETSSINTCGCAELIKQNEHNPNGMYDSFSSSNGSNFEK